jgi:hypothetical protein
MLTLHLDQMRTERGVQRPRKHSHPIFAPLPITYPQFQTIEVYVLDPQLGTLKEPQSRSVQKRCHEPARSTQTIQYNRHLAP